jgi:hypothetical protein
MCRCYCGVEAVAKVEALADDEAPTVSRRATALAVLLSVVLHVGVLVFLRVFVAHERQRTVTVIDIDTAPIAPKAEALPPEQEAAREPEKPAAADEPASEDDVPEAPPEGEGLGAVDAGVEMDAAPEPVDAGEAIDARKKKPRADAGVDAGAEETVASGVGDGDAGVGDGGVVDDGGAVAMGGGGDGDGGGVDDGGAVAMGEGGDGGPNDGGVVGADPAGVAGAKPSAGTNANLLAFFPRGHVVTVMVRLDRLRDTEWADRVDAILSPLPDYKSLVGDTNVRLTDIFDALVVSSPEPEDAVATTLVVKTRLSGPELRDYIDQPGARVKWSAVKGGALGRRSSSPRVFAGDQRVFLSWMPNWMVLTQPRDLGPLTTARAGDLDTPARPVDVPPWLTRAGTILGEAGEPTGPAIMMTASGMFGTSLDMLGPGGAAIPAPEQVTVTLEVDPKGLLVRGNMRFADESAAATAHDAIMRMRQELLDQYGSVPLLGGMPLLTVLRGLDIQRTGRRLAFASSASIADSRGILELAGSLIKTHFEEQERLMEERRRRRTPPKPSPAPAPKP